MKADEAADLMDKDRESDRFKQRAFVIRHPSVVLSELRRGARTERAQELADAQGIITVKAGSSYPTNRPAMSRCAVDEMGKNSVRPWMTPSSATMR